MSTVEATTAAAPAGTKKAAPKKAHAPADHPKYSEMVQQGLMALKERGGSSRQALLKYIMANFNVGKDEASVNSHLKIALRSGVKNASLKQSKGTGASGSFRLGTEANAAKKKAGASSTKKKAASTSAVKKSPKKSTTGGSKKTGEKKAKKPSAAKKEKSQVVKKTKKAAPKSPKKVVKKAAAKTGTTKKPAAAQKTTPPPQKPAAAPAKKQAAKAKTAAGKPKKA